jgi:DNA-binding GntR family transcriptional regulator
MNADELATTLVRFQRDGVPKYTALRDAIVHAVASGALVPGDRVPNEQELAATLPISLGTIQRALRQLVEEGVIQRRHGQGSFIAGRRADGEMSQPFHCRFLDDKGTGYLPVFPEALARRAAQEGEWSRWLGKGPLLEITRRIRIGDEFDVFSSFIVDGKRLPVFATLPLRKLSGENFKDLIFRACGQAIQKVDVFLAQRLPPAAVGEMLGIRGRHTCLAIRAVAFLGEADPVYYQQIFIPPNARELHVVTDSRSPGIAA